MVVLVTARQAADKLAKNLRERRLAMGITQAGLSARSGVPLGTLRKFEQTGLASIDALMKLMIAVGVVEAVLKATEPDAMNFASIDEVLNAKPKPTRKRGYRK